MKRKRYDKDSNYYPVARMHKYEVAPTIDGIAAGKRIEVRYAIVMRREFVPVGGEKGPFRDIYFKILPKGTCNIPGCILGFPVLDVSPFGLGHRLHSTSSRSSEFLFHAWRRDAARSTAPIWPSTWRAKGANASV